MKLAGNIICIAVCLLSLLNIGAENDLTIDALTSLLIYKACLLSCISGKGNKVKYLVLLISFTASVFYWKHQEYAGFGNLSDVLTTICLFICYPCNASLLLCMKTVINILLRAFDPTLFWLAESVDICICLYLFYDTKKIISTCFPKLRFHDGHRKTGI